MTSRTSRGGRTPAPPSRPTAPDTEGPAPERGPRRLTATAAVLVPTLLTAAHAAGYGRWTVDDAAITWAYARSIAAGAGPVLQPGAPAAEGWSNPTWLAVFVVVTWLGLPLVLSAKALALACCAGVFAGFSVAARALCPRPALVAGVAGCVTAAVPSFVIWSFSGLENPLYALLVTWLAVVMVRGPVTSPRVAALAGALAAGAAMTRPDGAVYLAAFPAVALLVARRRGVAPAAVSLAVAAVPVGAYLVWRVHRFGLLVPNTAIAKGQGAPEGGMLLELGGYGGVLVASSAVLGAVALVVVPAARSGLVALLVPLMLALVAYAVLEPDWMGELRFATPVWPLAALLLVVAVAVLRSRAAAVLGLVAVAASLLVWVPAARAFRASPTVPVCLVAQIDGRAMNGYLDATTDPAPTLLVPDVGGAALVGRARVVDLVGLTEPTVARDWRTGDMAGLRDHVFLRARPTLIAVHGPWATVAGILADPRLPAGYDRISADGGTEVWVRRDALRPGGLEQARRYRLEVAVPAEAEVRRAPRAGCPLG